MEIREVERETREAKERAPELEKEVEAHKERVDALEETVQELREALGDVGSDEGRQALEAAEGALVATEDRLEEKREERDNLVAENERLNEKVGTALEKRQDAQRKARMMDDVLNLDTGGEIGRQMGLMQDSLRGDIARLEGSQSELQEARQRLEAIDV